jgi:hypothetical protein
MKNDKEKWQQIFLMSSLQISIAFLGIINNFVGNFQIHLGIWILIGLCFGLFVLHTFLMTKSEINEVDNRFKNYEHRNITT